MFGLDFMACLIFRYAISNIEIEDNRGKEEYAQLREGRFLKFDLLLLQIFKFRCIICLKWKIITILYF